MSEPRETITIPVPLMAPLDIPINTKAMIQELWDTFVKPEQEKRIPQSVEMRALMAVLRAVHEGMPD